MAWQREVTEMVRVMIGDLSETPDYEDSRIERAILLSAHQLLNEINFNVTYTVNVIKNSISPDPSVDTRDEGFIYLLALKTSCLITTGELRKFAISSVMITDGPSTIDLSASFRNLKTLNDNLIQQYEKAKVLHQCGQLGQAITTPFGSEFTDQMYNYRGIFKG